MVFCAEDKVSIAFTLERREAGDTLCQEDAEYYALRELERQGLDVPGDVEIEAYENQSGWLIFCNVFREKPVALYIRFENRDDFLDAVGAYGAHGVDIQGWDAYGYTVLVTGSRERVAAFVSGVSEYGIPFEAPAGHILHLGEQSGY